jgi:hypothetical protein
MAGEYDEKFDQLTGLVETLAKKVDQSLGGIDELRLEMRDLRTELCDNTSRIGSLENKVDGLLAQFRDVSGLAIKDHPRIDRIAERIDVLESETH